VSERTPPLTKRLVLAARKATARWRPLPSALIIGAQKAGTTSLFDILARHPAMRRGRYKEVHFFDGLPKPGPDRFAEGEAWYRAVFPLQGAADSHLPFEATPSYLFDPDAPARIHTLLPKVKLIALLRDPVDRAISHYHHMRRHARETLDLADALAAEEERLAPAIAAKDWRDPAWRHFSYQARSRYLEQLQRYWTVFPEDQMLIVQSEILFSDPASVLARICEFLDIDPEDLTLPEGRKNAGDYSDDHADIRVQLAEQFKPDTAALFDRLGRRFDWPSVA